MEHVCPTGARSSLPALRTPAPPHMLAATFAPLARPRLLWGWGFGGVRGVQLLDDELQQRHALLRLTQGAPPL